MKTPGVRGREGRRWPLVGFVLGAAVGMTVLGINVVGASVSGEVSTPSASSRGLEDVLHRPPLLVARGESVRLSYDAVCQSDDFGGPCALRGSVFVRASGEEAFTRLPLVEEADSQLSASVPGRFTSSNGFAYYAVIANGSGEQVTLPAGGAAAPQHVWTASSFATIALAPHMFGQTRRPDRRVLSAAWGDGKGDLGLIDGIEQARIGPSAFDVAADGSVVVLDQVNHRLAVYADRGSTGARHVAIPFSGGEGDLAVGADGTTYVLDQGGPGEDGAAVRSFDRSGRLLSTSRLSRPGPDMLRVGPDGPIFHSYPSEMWLPALNGRIPLQAGEQAARARSGRGIGSDTEVVVSAAPSEAYLALVRGDRVSKAWRVTSSTRLGEIQLAEPFRSGLLVVLRVWTETKAEFQVLLLATSGLDKGFSVDAAEWAESATLSRFRLAGDTLYQLRSGSAGAEIVAFQIGGA